MIIIPEKPIYVRNFYCVTPSGGEADHLRLASEPDYKQVISDSNLRRRMGKLLKMAVYSGLSVLTDISSDDVAGIITATGIGFMKDTVKFADAMYDGDETLLNPSPFMQSTFNTASGYIALIRKIHAYNTTYVQRSFGLLSAFADAIMLICENPNKSVLVGGFDEAVSEVDALRRRLGLYQCKSGSFLPLGEGAGFFCLTDEAGTCRESKNTIIFRGMASAGESCSDMIHDYNDYDVVRCSDFVDVYGAFPMLLSVVAAHCLCQHPQSSLLCVDDVNPDGCMIFFEIR